MSFALVAVTILMLVSTSAVLTAAVEQEGRMRSAASAKLGEMRALTQEVGRELPITLYENAISCASSTTADDEAEYSREFSDILSSLSSNYPEVRGSFLVNANLSNAYLAFERAALRDLYPECNDASGDARVPVAFIICGFVIVNVSCPGSFIEREFTLSNPIPVPVPFIKDRAQALSSRMEGSNSEMELMVRAMLGALVQIRVLGGAGTGNSSVGDILTARDVRNAISLSYLLERSRLIGPADSAILPEAGPMLRQLFMQASDVDPAKLFLSLYGEGRLDLRMVLGQSLYASAEVIALRWMDYFHIIDLLSGAERVMEETGFIIGDVIEACLGIDLAEGRMRSWLSDAFAPLEKGESDYRLFHVSVGDMELTADGDVLLPCENGTREYFHVESRFLLDMPTVDLLGGDFLSSFFKDYKRNANEMAGILVDMIRSLAFEIAARADLPEIDLCARSFEAPDLWSEAVKLVAEAFDSSGDWLTPIIKGEEPALRDPMAQAFLAVLEDEKEMIFDRNDSIDNGMDDISRQALDLLWQQGAPVSLGEDGLALMKSQLAGMEVLPEMLALYDQDIEGRMSLFRQALEGKEAEGGGVAESIISLAAGAVSIVPGIEALMEFTVDQLIGSAASAASLRSANSTYRASIANVADRPALQVMDEAGWNEQLEITIISPDKTDGNTYDTDPLALEWTPYTSVWEVRVTGEVCATLVGEGDWMSLAGASASHRMNASVDYEMTIAAEGGWPLASVDYRSTRSMLGDIYGLWQKAMQWIKDALGHLAGAAGKVISFMKGLLQRLLSYSLQTAQSLSDILGRAVDGLYGLIQGAAARSAGSIVEGMASTIGSRNSTVHFLGLDVTVSVLPDDLSNAKWRTIISLTVGIPLPHSRLSATIRLVSVSGEYHFLGNCTLSASGWGLQVAIDPLMSMMGHAVIVRGHVSDKAFEVVMPEPCMDRVSELRLSSIPGVGAVLSNIPLPIPGIKGSFDAGLFVRNAQTDSGDLIINEFEQNPPGTDADHEWVEIFNPSSMPVSTVGYSLQTQHGRQALSGLGAGTIAAHSRQVYVLQGQCLDNEGELQFPKMECLSLIGPDGRKVDSTPWVQDNKDDGRTWQREYDGSGRWVFTESTQGKANGGLVGQALGLGAVQQALGNITSKSTLERSNDLLGSIRALVIRSVSSLVSGLQGGKVLEAGIFLEVGVSAVTGTASAVLRIALSVSGDLIRDLLEWVERVIDQLLGRFNAEGLGFPIDKKVLLEQSWLRAGISVQAGAPKYLGIAMAQVRLTIDVGCNLATIAAALGREVGVGRIEGGCRLNGISSLFLPSQLRSASATSDVYLFRFALWDR
jgi:hypothetical protein